MQRTTPPTIYFVRHGTTDWNRDHVYQGWNDVPLNQEGREQAQQLAGSLPDLGEIAVFSSPLARAVETASLVFGESREVALVNDLREASSREAAEFVLRRMGISPLPSFDRIPSGAESPEQFLARVERGLATVLEQVAGTARVPVLVAHGGVCTALCEHLGIRPPIETPNCCLIKFEPDRRGHYTATAPPRGTTGP